MDKKVLKVGVTNCYLVGIGDKYLLVDTGYDNKWELFCQRLQEVGVGLSDISHVLLTHHHDDHCGLLNRVLEENPDIRVIMSYHAQDYLLAGRNAPATGGGYVNKRVNLLASLMLLFDKRLVTHPFPPYQSRAVDILIRRDTSLEEIGIGLDGRILETPGHSQDSISLLFYDGDCLAGDAAASFPQFLRTNYCVVIIQDVETYYASWRKLIAAGARQIFPAHGAPFSVEKLEQNINKNSQKDLVPMS